MRILLDYRPALRQRTGVGEYIHEVARALAATAPPRESIHLFSSSWKDRLSPGAVPGLDTLDQRIPGRLLNLLWHRLEWPAVERLAKAPFDVVQAAHPLLVPTEGAARLVTIYDLDFLDHPEWTRAEIRRDYPALAARHAQRADGVIVISKHTASEVERRLGVHAARISICVPGAPAWPRRETEPAEGGCILFLGTLDPRKNVGVLLDAYERLLSTRPNIPPLVLAGAATPSSAALIARTRQAPLAGHVELPGYVSEAEKRDLYKRALVFVLPSHMEGFGMPVLEAMTSGVPVVAANRGALPEAVGSAGQLFDPTDAEALGVALDRILASADLRRRMSDEGWQHARQFTWTNAAAGMRDAWTRALGARQPAP